MVYLPRLRNQLGCGMLDKRDRAHSRMEPDLEPSHYKYIGPIQAHINDRTFRKVWQTVDGLYK